MKQNLSPETREAIADVLRKYRNAPYPVPTGMMQLSIDRIASLITAQIDMATNQAAQTAFTKLLKFLESNDTGQGVTDEQIKEAAMKYATKPLAPYLRSEVFIDACKWLLSELARREGGGKLPCGCDANGNPVFWNEFNNVVQCHKCGDVYLPSPPKTIE